MMRADILARLWFVVVLLTVGIVGADQSVDVTVAPGSTAEASLRLAPGETGYFHLVPTPGYLIESSHYSNNPDSGIWKGSNPLYWAIPSVNAPSGHLNAQVTGVLKPDTPPGEGGGTPPDLTFDANLAAETTEIQINDTPEQNDDIVQVKCAVTGRRFTVPCRIRGKNLKNNLTVTITSPDGRLKFPDGNSATVTLDKNGDWATFEISGESNSGQIDDAAIEAKAGQQVVGRENATVFYWDQPSITMTKTAHHYKLETGVQEGVDFVHYIAFSLPPVEDGPYPAMSYTGKATLTPQGLNVNAPSLDKLSLSFTQNVEDVAITMYYTNPTVVQDYKNPPSRPLVVADHYTRMLHIPDEDLPMQDSQSVNDDPLQVAERIVGPQSNGMTQITSDDMPSARNDRYIILEIEDAQGNPVADVRYELTRVILNMAFRTYLVSWVFGEETVCPLRQHDWGVDADSASPGAQDADPAQADAAPAGTPKTGEPNYNEYASDFENFQEAESNQTINIP